MSPGDEILLLDNSGQEYKVRLTKLSRDVVEAEVLAVDQGRGEPRIEINLYQAILKGSKFDLVLQKGTELGVAAFVPVICHRTIPKKKGDWDRTRYPHWRKIVQEAAEQSGRSRLPMVQEAVSFEDACNAVQGTATSLIPWEGEAENGLREALRDSDKRRINIFIGPEGGFEEQEIGHARASGVVPVSLGRRGPTIGDGGHSRHGGCTVRRWRTGLLDYSSYPSDYKDDCHGPQEQATEDHYDSVGGLVHYPAPGCRCQRHRTEPGVIRNDVSKVKGRNAKRTQTQ